MSTVIRVVAKHPFNRHFEELRSQPALEVFFCDIKAISDKMKLGIDLRCAGKPLIEKKFKRKWIFSTAMALVIERERKREKIVKES